MIMSEKERNDYSEGKAAFFPENHVFEIVSGKTFNLDNIYDKAEWEAIENCPLIAKSRDERDINGNLVIDYQYIAANGNVINAGCQSYDLMDQYALGNVKKQSMEEIYLKGPTKKLSFIPEIK